MKALKLLAIAAIAAIFIFRAFAFPVEQYETGIMLQFGKPVGGVLEPGLNFRIPLVHRVVTYDSRMLEYDAAPREVITKDKKNLKVDNYAIWRIVDPLTFYRSVTTYQGAQARLDDIIYSVLREQLGKYDLIEIVAQERATIMNEVTAVSNKAAAEYGIEVSDVRIKRADLPDENAKHVYDRMKAERTRQAKRYRAEGEETAKKLTSQADKERSVILADAYAKAETIKGEGDAEATRIYAEAFNRDPEFYDFINGLEVYKESISDEDVLIMSPKDQIFKYLGGDRVKK